VTQRVKDALALVPSDKQTLSIAAFGAKRGSSRPYDLVRVTIKGRSGHQQEMELFVVLFICDPLMAQPVDMTAEEFSHLAQLDLADSHDSSSPLEVDVLIGSDLYWDILTGETIRGQCGPVDIGTRFGWVLSGPTISSRV